MKVKKRRKKSRSLIVLYVGIIISVNLIGLGYGNWSTTIHINNTMRTGSVETAFAGDYISEDGDKHNLSLDMNVKMNDGIVSKGILSGKSFEIINNGTLPVEINYETFQPVSEINIAGVPMKVKVYIDAPPSEFLNGAFENQYVMPGQKFYGRVSIDILGGGKPINYIANNTTDLSNVESLNISSNSDGTKEKVVTVCTKEMQNVPVSIPIGCGIWEDTLVLNVNVNVNITTHVKVPIVDALPGIVTEDSGNSQIDEQNKTLSPSIDNIVNDSIIDEKETGSVIENEQSNVESLTVDENITSGNGQIGEQNEEPDPSIDNTVNDSIIDEKEADSVMENEQSNTESPASDENITSEGSVN